MYTVKRKHFIVCFQAFAQDEINMKTYIIITLPHFDPLGSNVTNPGPTGSVDFFSYPDPDPDVGNLIPSNI
jgi:hypothetical protein